MEPTKKPQTTTTDKSPTKPTPATQPKATADIGASSPPKPDPKAPTSPTAKPTEQKTAAKQYTAADIAKELGLPNAAVVRRYLRAAQLHKPKDGWVWADKAAAKDVLEALRGALKAEAKRS